MRKERESGEGMRRGKCLVEKEGGEDSVLGRKRRKVEWSGGKCLGDIEELIFNFCEQI